MHGPSVCIGKDDVTVMAWGSAGSPRPAGCYWLPEVTSLALMSLALFLYGCAYVQSGDPPHPGLSNPQPSDGGQYVSPNGNDSNDGLSAGTAKLTAQAALNAVPIGGTVTVTGGTIAQGSTPLTITGRSLVCNRGAIITFNGLSSSTDAVTIQGWSGTAQYPLTVDGCTFITSASGSASGRDLIQISGGNHVTLKNLFLLDPGRDTIHVEPSASFSWIENLTLDNILSNTCGSAFNGCTGTVSASPNLRDDLNFSLGDKFSSSLTSVYINEVTISKLDLRAHARYGEHWYSNNSCTGCAMQTYLFTDTHTDGAGRVPAATPDIYLERGGSGAVNTINLIAWASGDSEDTVTSRTGPVFKASGASIGQGIFIGSGWTYSNFATQFDSNFPADLNYGVFDQLNNSDVRTTPSAFWNNGTPTAAASVGLMCPGSSSPGNSLVVCTYNGSWTSDGTLFGVVYSTPSSSTNSSIGATTMATAGSSGDTYRVSFYADVTVAGTSCSGNSTLDIDVTFTDPNASASNTYAYYSGTIITNGSVGAVVISQGGAILRAKSDTAVQYSTTFTPGSGCSLAPSYQVYPIMDLLN
jgi:hypothetical protein